MYTPLPKWSSGSEVHRATGNILFCFLWRNTPTPLLFSSGNLSYFPPHAVFKYSRLIFTMLCVCPFRSGHSGYVSCSLVHTHIHTHSHWLYVWLQFLTLANSFSSVRFYSQTSSNMLPSVPNTSLSPGAEYTHRLACWRLTHCLI